MSLNEKYQLLFNKVIKNEVVDPASYMEYYTYKLICENKAVTKYGNVKNNFKMKDDLPISHAIPGPDIEVYLDKVAFICECSLRSGRKQFDDEHESVSRHFENFNKEHKKNYSSIMCFFIAPKINDEMKDWYFLLYPEVNVIPVKLDDFILLMNKLHNLNIERYEEILVELATIIDDSPNSEKWSSNISFLINEGNNDSC